MEQESHIDRQQLVILAIFFTIYCFCLSWSFWFQNVDDAYISFRYGQNLMNGNGLVYNKGEYVEGYTNFLWTIITAPFTKVKSIDISRFAIVLGLLVSILNIYVLTRISGKFKNFFEGLPKYFVLVPALFFVLDDTVAFWAIGGMEFPLYMLLILGIIYFYFSINNKPGSSIYLSISMILCTMTRPEGNMIFVLTIFHSFFYRKKIENYRKNILYVIGLYFLFAVVYYGFKDLYYGQVIPNTFYAKGVTDISMNMWLGFKYLALCLGTRLYVFVFILFIPFREILRDFKQSFLLLFSVIYVLYIWAVGGDWMIANRFFVPIIPIFYILSMIGLSNALRKLITSYPKWSVKINKICGFSVVVIGVLIFFITLGLLEYKQLIIKDENYRYEMQWSMFGKWLKLNTSPETVIAVGPAGKIPYYSELYTVDMWGLNNNFIANTKSKRLQAGHKKFDLEYVLSYHPEFIIGYAGFNDHDIPSMYEKFNAPDDKYKSIDVVFRLKPEFRNKN